MPSLISGKCAKRNYLISIIIINVAEVATVIYLFSKFQHYAPANLWNIYNDIATLQRLYIVIFVCNNIITVKRCKTVELKKYNYIIPGLQFFKIIGLVTCIFILIKKLDRAGFLSFNESATIWIPLAVFITITNGIQILYLHKDERNDNKINFSIRDKIIKYVMVCLIVIEMMTAVSAMITFGYYDRFWKINGYVHTWFWLDGLVGIVLFVFGMCYMDRIIFKKESIRFLIIPLLSSFIGFIGVVMTIINPFYDSGLEILKALCYIIGFPIAIIFSLQDRYRINKFLIGTMAVLTPLARFVVFINIWGR